MLYKYLIYSHLHRKRLLTNLKKLKIKTWFKIQLKVLQPILINCLKYKTMLLTKVEILLSSKISNIIILRPNLGKITILQARAFYKTKFKLIKVKQLKGWNSNQLKTKCVSRWIIIIRYKVILNSDTRQL